MIISVYGAGYVGLVTAVCLSKLGHRVLCGDINKARVALLNSGHCPIFEKDLPELLREQLQSQRLQFSDDLKYLAEEGNIHLIATGTPGEAGPPDLSQVYAVATLLADTLTKPGLVVIKSTVPVGTGQAIEHLINQRLTHLSRDFQIDVVSNPEFLREGTAVADFFHTDRIILGGKSQALLPLERLYAEFHQRAIPIVCMSRESAELTKYAANAMLACRVSFINQIALLAETMGADIEEVSRGMGLDERIGPAFLKAGIGYGGSCFPKDGRALVYMAESKGLDLPLLKAIDEANTIQKYWLINKLSHYFAQNLRGKRIGIWGLAFKPHTDDIREACSLTLLNELLAKKALPVVYDPVAILSVRERYGEQLTYCDSAEQVLQHSLDALLIVTEWPEFTTFSLERLKNYLPQVPIFDGRNCFDLAAVRAAQLAHYYSVGRPVVSTHLEVQALLP